ncbi:hypothetical protein Nepgr_032122 [Nepenthes gracilis]|uniref:Uncharacterized protein n=1 Tax=Nepenthes gracilis TaxID=150966 RepID=A0AAD3TJD7_NEPGR|nr:hypothetical protein Nepgr_032122 [Nepenthes gracilis]
MWEPSRKRKVGAIVIRAPPSKESPKSPIVKKTATVVVMIPSLSSSTELGNVLTSPFSGVGDSCSIGSVESAVEALGPNYTPPLAASFWPYRSRSTWCHWSPLWSPQWSGLLIRWRRLHLGNSRRCLLCLLLCRSLHYLRSMFLGSFRRHKEYQPPESLNLQLVLVLILRRRPPPESLLRLLV